MSLDHLKNERDYYMKECQNLMEKMRNMCNNKPSLDTVRFYIIELLNVFGFVCVFRMEASLES